MNNFDAKGFVSEVVREFGERRTRIDFFNDHITYIDVDILRNSEFHVSMEVKEVGVGISKTKKVQLESDFGLYDHYFRKNSDAIDFLKFAEKNGDLDGEGSESA